jgi:hypothetical protein
VLRCLLEGVQWLFGPSVRISGIRIKKNMRLASDQRLSDGSYLSRIYPSEHDGRHRTNGVVVRVIDYRLEGVTEAEPLYRFVTTLLDPGCAFRRLQPSIPIETSHLFRTKPAGHSDDPSRVTMRVASG